MKIRLSIPSSLIPAIVLLVAVAVQADDLKQCVRFLAPEQKAIIAAPFCTLGVASSCKPIAQVTIMARYLSAHADSAIVDTIARLKGPSFRYIWNLSSVPNQLSMGIGIIIEATFSDGEVFGIRREGIFLAHQRIDYPTLTPLAYGFPEARSFARDTLEIVSTDPSRREFAQVYWNEQSVAVRVTVRDPAFSGAPAGDLLDRMGIEICADPEKKRSLYPSDEVLIVSVPLSGQPCRKTFQPTFNDDGTYELNVIKTRLNLSYAIEKQDNRGFTATVAIPAYLFGKSIPHDMGFNIVVTTGNGRGGIVTSSLIAAEGANNYSPLLWPTLTILPKPISKVFWILWLACFCFGIAIPLVVYLLLSAFAKASPHEVLSRLTDAEKKEFESVRDAIDRSILLPDAAAGGIAEELQISLKQLKTRVKKATGLSFGQYLMYLRTEIASERLRSSDGAEETIAATSGFRDAREMRRNFQRIFHMSPGNFRNAQQITHR